MKKLLFYSLLFLFLPVNAQERSRRATTDLKPPTCLSFQEDKAFMMNQLDIESLRPGKNGDASAENGANYDEEKANPFKELPDPLRMLNGKKIKTGKDWWEKRRPEIMEVFEREVYGRVPENAPVVNWEVEISEREYIGWTPVIAKKLKGKVDNSIYPLIDVEIEMVLVTPERAEGPVPVLMMFGPAELPAPAQPNPDDFQKINAALKAFLARDPEIKELLDKYPAYDPLVRPEGVNSWGFRNRREGPPSRTEELIQAGWGYAMINPSSIQADNAEGLTCGGVIALVNRGKPRNPDDWGALRAWSWGAARALDYMETDPAVDASKVGIEGVSRYGKAALVTLAFEERFAFGLIGSSGKGGTTLHRRSFGEAVENLTGGMYYWMAGNYLKYGASDIHDKSMDANDLQVDSHELIALCAPRPVFISYGIPEKGDAHWLDHLGSYMAAVAAQPVYQLLGARGLGVSNDYWSEKMPPVNEGLLEGDIAWRQHDGGHTDAPNIKYFIEWANERMTEEK